MEWTKIFKAAPRLTWRSNTDCLTGDKTSRSFRHFYGWVSHTCDVTGQICPRTLIVLLTVLLLCPGARWATTRMRVREIPTLGYDGRWFLTWQPTFRVKVDDAAVGLAPGTQEHSSSFHDLRLAGVGLRSTNQNTESRRQKGGTQRKPTTLSFTFLNKLCTAKMVKSVKGHCRYKYSWKWWTNLQPFKILSFLNRFTLKNQLISSFEMEWRSEITEDSGDWWH